MVAIETYYIGPSNVRGSRYKARVMATTPAGLKPYPTVTLSADDRLDSSENHKAAARALIAKMGWTTANGYADWVIGGSERGYVFVCASKSDTL